MHVLFSVIFLIPFRQCYCLSQRICTTEERCLPVDASVCDNSRCLLLNKSDLDITANGGLKSYAWNIGSLRFFAFCPWSIMYEAQNTSDGAPTMRASITVHSGKRCNESMTVKLDYVADPDPSMGQMRLLTKDYYGYKYEECYLYLERGKAFVYRKCLVQPNYPSGKACASIIAKTAASEKCVSDGLVDFLYNLDVDLPQISSDCI